MNSTQLTFALFGIPVILCSLGLILAARSAMRRTRKSQSWPMAVGRIVSARIEERVIRSRSGETHQYWPVIVYEYMVAGNEYQSDRVSFGGSSSSSFRGRAQKSVTRYPEGATALVYYDPENPEEAVLERKAGSAVILGAIGVLLLVAAMGAGVYVFGPPR